MQTPTNHAGKKDLRARFVTRQTEDGGENRKRGMQFVKTSGLHEAK